jgi:hypothetical protein
VEPGRETAPGILLVRANLFEASSTPRKTLSEPQATLAAEKMDALAAVRASDGGLRASASLRNGFR